MAAGTPEGAAYRIERWIVAQAIADAGGIDLLFGAGDPILHYAALALRDRWPAFTTDRDPGDEDGQ